MWKIEYYQKENGRFPVAEFIDSLDLKSRAKIAWTLDLLEKHDIRLQKPHVQYLEEQLWELRIQYSRNQHRIIYFLDSIQTFVMLHGFTKKSRSVSRRDIKIAKTRQDDYLSKRR